MNLLRFLFACALLWAPPAGAQTGYEQRRVAVFWDSSVSERWRDTTGHQLLEMPLNRLGYAVVPIDAAKPLPDPASIQDLRAVVLWFEGDALPDPGAVFGFVERVQAQGGKLVVMGDPGLLRRAGGGDGVALADANRAFARAGFRLNEGFVRLTFDAEVLRKDSAMVEFERKLDPVLPPFSIWRPADARATSHLVVRRRNRPDTESHVVIVGPGGGLAAVGFTHFFEPELKRRQWRLDPFAFLAAALGHTGGPMPDVTTLAGRRIFFSHIDGDGWRNLTEIQPWRRGRKLSAEVVLDDVLLRYPELPVTVAPIAGDLHPDWCGTEEGRDLARRMFALPHVEPASHTWSHPLDWSFFARADANPVEATILRRYPGCGENASRLQATWRRVRDRVAGPARDAGAGSETRYDHPIYETPRTYAMRPFDLEAEFAGAARWLETLAPPGTRIGLVQWSGNTLPYANALAAARRAGLRNINGGDTRFDREFPSVGYVAPVGRREAGYFQVYAAASNENTYTDLWTDRFFGFRALAETIENTGAPRRLTPVNLYYHVYIAEKEAALRSLHENIAAIRELSIVPIFASHYAAIAEGFDTARFARVGPRAWRIEDRGSLQTLRFDPPLDAAAVDFTRSSGVLGFTRAVHALYVALDPDAASPVVALGEPGDAAVPYLVHSRWPVRALAREAREFSFKAGGFGAGEMVWRVAPNSRWRVSRAGAEDIDVNAGGDGVLRIDAGSGRGREIDIRFSRLDR
jgi:polysaccharide biosynthesis protein PelA